MVSFFVEANIYITHNKAICAVNISLIFFSDTFLATNITCFLNKFRAKLWHTLQDPSGHRIFRLHNDVAVHNKKGDYGTVRTYHLGAFGTNYYTLK